MKIISIILIVAIFVCACKKESFTRFEDIRLTGTETQTQSGGILKSEFDFDEMGRITKVTSRFDTFSVPVYTISYSGNQVLLTFPGDPSDSIWLNLRADGNVESRITHYYFEPTAPYWQQGIYFDTLIHEYDAAGLRSKSTYHLFDSSWNNPGTNTIYSRRRQKISSYNNADANIASLTYEENTISNAISAGNTTTTIRKVNGIDTYEYHSKALNKTDFKNAAILDELQLLWTPVNYRYKYLPDKITVTQVMRDENNNVLSTDNYTMSTEYNYNTFGFLKTKLLVPLPPRTVTFIYSE